MSRPTSFQLVALRALSAIIRLLMNAPGAHDYAYKAIQDINESITRGFPE